MTKQPLMVRPATVADVPNLSFLWHENMVLYQQLDQRIRLMPDARKRWETCTVNWIVDDARYLLVAERANELFGFIVGLIEESPPGLLPEKVGLVTDLVIDAHSHERGVGQILLDELCRLFTDEGIEQMVARTRYCHAVEQAFWRAQGATEWIDLLWLK